MTRAGTDRLARHVAALLAEYIHAIIHKEMKPMVDAVSDLTAATDSALSVIGELLAEVQKDVAALAVLPKDNTAALEVQIERLKTGTDAAAAALASLQNPAPAEAAPAAEAPAEAPPEAPAA